MANRAVCGKLLGMREAVLLKINPALSGAAGCCSDVCWYWWPLDRGEGWMEMEPPDRYRLCVCVQHVRRPTVNCWSRRRAARGVPANPLSRRSNGERYDSRMFPFRVAVMFWHLYQIALGLICSSRPWPTGPSPSLLWMPCLAGAMTSSVLPRASFLPPGPSTCRLMMGRLLCFRLVSRPHLCFLSQPQLWFSNSFALNGNKVVI